MPGKILAMVLIAGPLLVAETLTTGPEERTLQSELVAPCCYRETVDRHESDAAVRMRAEIHTMVIGGRSEREILEYYNARYGSRILAEPEGLAWWIGTSVPLVAFALGIGLVLRLIWKWSSARGNPPSPARGCSCIAL